MSWIPNLLDIIMYKINGHIIKRREAGMEEASSDIIYNAIEIFKERYGIKTPLDLERMDKIIVELKEASKKPKRRRSK